MRGSWLVVVALGACGDNSVLPPLVDAEPLPPVPDADPCPGCECIADDECGDPYAVCDLSVPAHVCACLAGYTKDADGACTWTGVVADPEITSAAAWSADAEVTLQAGLEDGQLDAGFAHWTPAGHCALARLAQDVTMPRRDRAQPLVATISYRGDNFFGSFAAGVSLDGTAVVRGAAANTWTQRRACLGPAAYAPADTEGPGATMPLRVSPFGASDSCGSVEFNLDHLDIAPAMPGECAASGEVLGGDAESELGWIFSTGGNSTAALEPGVGQDGTAGARIHVTSPCSSGSASVPLSVPVALDMPSPALQFFHRGTAGSSTMLALEGAELSFNIFGTGDSGTRRLCLPATLRGQALRLTATLDISGVCADVVDIESVFDNIELVDDPSCGTDPGLADPGFESGLPPMTDTSLVNSAGGPQMDEVNSGLVALRFVQTSSCLSSRLQVPVIAPPADGDRGPALRFAFHAPTTLSTMIASSPVGYLEGVRDETWHSATLCLDPAQGEFPQEVLFRHEVPGGGACAETFDESVFLDDLELTTDASCPTD